MSKMPQRKPTAAGARDEARTGKSAAAAAATTATGGGTTRGGGGAATTSSSSNAATDASPLLPYTADEVNFLHTHLRQLSALQAGNGSSGGNGNAAAAAEASAWRDMWPSLLPTLTSIVGKALKLAEDNYTIRTAASGGSAATAAAGGGNAAATAASGSHVATFSNGIGMDSSNSNNSYNNNRDSLGKSTTVSGTSATLRDCAAGDASTNASSVQPLSHAQFAEENAYLLEQLQQLPCAPFTLVRLLEILANPLQYHRNADGKLRGDMLQASLRRCILVSFPAFAVCGGGVMVEPHVFCGPEFTLQVPREAVDVVFVRSRSSDDHDHGEHDAAVAEVAMTTTLVVRDEVLLQLQESIYSVCTTALRHRLHTTYSNNNNSNDDVASSSSRWSAAPPAAPSRVCFVAVTAPDALSSEERAALQHTRRVLQQQQQQQSSHETVQQQQTQASHAAGSANATVPDDSVYTLLRITDSRVAGEMYMLALRNVAIALAHGCRLHCYVRAMARAAPVVLRDVRAKREQLRAHYNLDADLWSALQERCTPAQVQAALAAVGAAGDRDASGRLLTASEQHTLRVRALLRYCEAEVQYAAVLDADEQASPFLCAFGLLHALQLTMDDVLRHVLTHPRRVVRALGLFVARYVVAPEDMDAYVRPCLHDAVVIACSHDLAVTHSLRELCLALLRSNEVGEAWLPAYHAYWLEHVIEPCIARLQARHEQQQQLLLLQQQQQAAAQAQQQQQQAQQQATQAQRPSAHALVGGSDSSSSGRRRPRARGVAASLGFRRLADVAAYALAHERSLAPQHMSTLLARQRVRADADASGVPITHDDDHDDDDHDDDDDSDDGFLIRVTVARGGSADNNNKAQSMGIDTAVLPHDAPAAVAAAATAASSSSMTRVHSGRAAAATAAVVDAHAMFVAKGNKLLLSLLGRTRPFSTRDEHYLEY